MTFEVSGELGIQVSSITECLPYDSLLSISVWVCYTAAPAVSIYRRAADDRANWILALQCFRDAFQVESAKAVRTGVSVSCSIERVADGRCRHGAELGGEDLQIRSKDEIAANHKGRVAVSIPNRVHSHVKCVHAR